MSLLLYIMSNIMFPGARGAPSSAPSNIKVMPLAEDSISIRFDVDRNSAQFFQIRRESRIKPSVDREYQEHDSLYLLNITRNYHHFSNLQPNTQYMFDVRAFNGGKPSSWSAKVSAITQEAGFDIISILNLKLQEL